MSFRVHSLVYIFSLCHNPVHVFVCVCSRAHACAFLLHHHSFDINRLHSLVFFFFYWGHIPVQVFVCVSVYSCALLFAPLFVWCHLKSFFFLVSHPSASVCVSLCMAVPFFLHHYSSDVIVVNSLVCHHSLGHITVRVRLCMSVPLF